MAPVVDWDGEHVPVELRSLPPGRYLVERLDETVALTPEEEEGIRQAMASLEAHRGRSLEEVREHVLSTMKRGRQPMNPTSNNVGGDPPLKRPVLLLDYLLRIRKDMLAGRLAMHIGEPNIEHMVGFVNGYHSCLISNGITDEEYGQFREWLRERGEFPTEGWDAKYLRDCNGDHEQAIRKYLDFVAQFVALHRQ